MKIEGTVIAKKLSPQGKAFSVNVNGINAAVLLVSGNIEKLERLEDVGTVVIEIPEKAKPKKSK